MIGRAPRYTLVAFGIALGAGAAGPEAEVSVRTPRAFGYTVGDVLTETVRIAAGPGTHLDETTLPRRGRADAWLEVRSVSVASEPRGDRRDYEIRIEYQIANAPKELKTIALPALTFGIVGPEGRSKRSVGDVPVNVGPITTDLVRVGLEEMRGDVEAEPFPIEPARRAVARDGVLAAVALVAYALLRGRFSRRGAARPFARACAELARARDASADGRLADGLRVVHRAFDAVAGGTLFAEGLEPFLAERAVPEPLKARTRAFFARSRRAFFESPGPTGDTDAELAELAELASLCREWRDAEAARA